ncbi:MAG: lipase family protein [Clostridia bacterium]|nr:lipase family protein [Clostridia bacterium]
MNTVSALKRLRKKMNKALALLLCAALLAPVLVSRPVNAESVSLSLSAADPVKHRIDGSLAHEMHSDEFTDTDGDGVADYLEKYYGTDPEAADTDGDGLNDYIELFVLGTDSLLIDTNGDGVSDADEDADSDGLSNIDEVRCGTSLTDADTDGDGLDDLAEVRVYASDPLKLDTDSDGLLDGEEAALGLDPKSPFTDGKTADSQRKFNQALDKAAFDASLFDSNAAIPAVSGYVRGAIEKHVFVRAADPYSIKNNPAVYGKSVIIETDYSDFALKLSFDCASSTDRFPTLMICRYEDGRIEPCVSERIGSTLCTCVTEGGCYFVINAERLLGHINSPAYGFIGNYKASGKTEGVRGEEIIDDGTWVLLSDYQLVKLASPLANDGFDTDGDGVSDADELGSNTVADVSPYINWVLDAYDIPEGMYSDASSVTVYNYISNPVLPDTDFDGRNDDIDHLKKDNSFHGELRTAHATSSISMNMDHRWFFADNESYNPQLSKASLLLASVIYGGESRISLYDSANHDSSSAVGIRGMLSFLGFRSASSASIAPADYHGSEIALGYRTVEFEGVERTVLALVIRGTNGTLAEWSSNFDVGDASTFASTSEWTNYRHHKGFDVTANRLMSIVNSYIDLHGLDRSTLTYWITGHSRGAAIANLIGAKLEREGKRAFTYTFAAPNTARISRNEAISFRSIFNIVNLDDLVCFLPMEGWGYTRYGRSASLSLAANYEYEWEQLTHIWDYNPDTIGMDNTVYELTNVVHGDPNVECHRYTCSCHGDGSCNNITIRNRGMSRNSRETAIAKIPVNALPHCRITRYDGRFIFGWDFEVCQTPAYFMQVLAAKMGGEISNYRFVVELDIADRYEAAKAAIIRSAISGIEHPHYTESYYVLANNIGANLFN